jgi:hypothetical protein
MCPACIATTALVVGAATSASGVVVLIARIFRANSAEPVPRDLSH